MLKPGIQVIWKLVRWVLLVSKSTGLIIALAGDEFCISHHQLSMFDSLYTQWFSVSAMYTGSYSRYVSYTKCGKWNCTQSIISWNYNFRKIHASTSSHLSVVNPKLTSVGSFHLVQPNMKNSILKLSSPHRRCGSNLTVVPWTNYSTCLKLYGEWNWHHRFHSSEYLWYLLYNSVALWYTAPPLLSSTTTSL